MPKTFVLAEKPSVARDIARVLGCKDRLDGAIGGPDHIVSWAVGHLVSLMEPDELDPAYKKWRMDHLPILPDTMRTKVIDKTKAQFNVIKHHLASKDITQIICATDSGREGELIFRYIYHQCGCQKPVMRLWISSMTDSAIRAGLEKMRPDAEYDPLYASARCRSEADWLVGMNASRAFTLRYDALLPIGRVQTPTLNLIVQRDLEIVHFEPVLYHEVRAHFGDYEGLYWDPEKKEARCYDPELAAQMKRDCPGKTGTVTESTREMKKTAPPPLYDLTSLQRDANRQIGLSAANTLKIAQSLYEEHKLITYPRTDSRYLPKDMIPQVKKVLRAMPTPYAGLAQPVLDVQTPFGRVINDKKVSDHHAIIPTGQFANLGKLNPDQRKLFDMICRRLIAVHYPDYEYESTQVRTQVEGHMFHTSGTTPVVWGWRALYRDVVSDAQGRNPARTERGEDAEKEIPRLGVGDTRNCASVSVKKQQTKPPAPHTDASLLQMMENAGKLVDDEALQDAMKDSGLGTPATRAAIIERLIQVKYVQRKGKALASTEKGKQLIQVAPEEIRSAEMTGRWERALAAMARETDPDALARRETKFMQSIRRYSAFLVESAKSASESIAFTREYGEDRTKKKAGAKPHLTGDKCPACGQGEVQVTAKAFGCTRWREGCKYTVWLDGLTRAGGPMLTEAMMHKLLLGETLPAEGGVVEMRDGRPAWRKLP